MGAVCVVGNVVWIAPVALCARDGSRGRRSAPRPRAPRPARSFSPRFRLENALPCGGGVDVRLAWVRIRPSPRTFGQPFDSALASARPCHRPRQAHPPCARNQKLFRELSTSRPGLPARPRAGRGASPPRAVGRRPRRAAGAAHEELAGGLSPARSPPQPARRPHACSSGPRGAGSRGDPPRELCRRRASQPAPLPRAATLADHPSPRVADAPCACCSAVRGDGPPTARPPRRPNIAPRPARRPPCGGGAAARRRAGGEQPTPRRSISCYTRRVCARRPRRATARRASPPPRIAIASRATRDTFRAVRRRRGGRGWGLRLLPRPTCCSQARAAAAAAATRDGVCLLAPTVAPRCRVARFTLRAPAEPPRLRRRREVAARRPTPPPPCCVSVRIACRAAGCAFSRLQLRRGVRCHRASHRVRQRRVATVARGGGSA